VGCLAFVIAKWIENYQMNISNSVPMGGRLNLHAAFLIALIGTWKTIGLTLYDFCCGFGLDLN
jgi:hypothetical protein